MALKCLDPQCAECSADKMTCNKCNAGWVFFGFSDNKHKFCVKNTLTPSDYQDCKTRSSNKLSCTACNEGSKLEDAIGMGYKVCVPNCYDP